MAVFAGRLSDLKGRRNCLVFGAIIFALATSVPAIWPDQKIALTARFVNGIGKNIIMIASAAIVSDVVPKSRMNEGMGYFNLGGTLSMAFGPLIGLEIAENGGYNLLFLVCAVFCLSAGALGIGINYENKTCEQGTQSPERLNVTFTEYSGIWKMIEKKAILYSLNNGVFTAGYTCVLFFVTIYAQEQLLLSSAQIGLFYTIAAAMMFIVRFFFSKFGDIYGVLSLIVPGHICAMLTLLVLAFFTKGNYPMFLVSGGLYGLGFAAVAPAVNAAAVVDSPNGRSGAANATFYFFLDFGVLFASAVYGAMIDSASTPAAGYTKMYLTGLGITGLSLVMALTLMNNKARERRRAR